MTKKEVSKSSGQITLTFNWKKVLVIFITVIIGMGVGFGAFYLINDGFDGSEKLIETPSYNLSGLSPNLENPTNLSNDEIEDDSEDSSSSTSSSGSSSSSESDNGDSGDETPEEEIITNCLDACSSEGYDQGKDGSGGAGACFAYETFVQKDTFDCCCWNEFECQDTDGLNFAIKGTCTDTRTLTDNCMDGDFGNMLTEYFCTDEAQNWCSEVVHVCDTDDATCYDGRCIVDNLDWDGDGVTDLDEYRDGTDPNDPADFADICEGVDSDNTHLDPIASYQIEGTCSDLEGDFTDYCESGWLVEYWCGDVGGCGSDEATSCDTLLGVVHAYCMDGRCFEATPADGTCSSECALAEMGYTSGGFCGDLDGIPADPGVMCDGGLGVYLHSAEADLTCGLESCCCFVEF